MGQFPEEDSSRQVVFALLSSVKFAGVKAETDATHSIMIILALITPAETLDLEWQVQRVSPPWRPLPLVLLERLCSDERLGGVACLLDSRAARFRSRS